MSDIWDAQTYDAQRRRLVPCFDAFYGTALELVRRTVGPNPTLLDLGAGTGILSGLIAEGVSPKSVCLIDSSAEMLAQAQMRLQLWRPHAIVQELTDPLPAGPYDAVASALAIHHLTDADKRSLFQRIFQSLKPGGIFVNAEQVRGATEWEESMFEQIHLSQSRRLGSSEQEIAGAVQRMSHDRCAPLVSQLQWLREFGYANVDCFYQWFRFAVYAGWKPK